MSEITIKDINNSNLALINEVYKDYFSTFGYKMWASLDEEYDISEFIPLPEFGLKNVKSVYDLELSLLKNEN